MYVVVVSMFVVVSNLRTVRWSTQVWISTTYCSICL